MRTLRNWLAAAAVVAASATAFSQDYEVVNPADLEVGDDGYADVQWRSPPTSATSHSLGDDAFTSRNLPFDFVYFGQSFSNITIHSNGFAQLNSASPSRSQYSNSTFPPNSGADWDGMIAPLWDDIYPPAGGTIKSWTIGTSPNRTFILSWDRVYRCCSSSSGGPYNFQLQLFETTDQIAFAYTNTGATWSNLSYSVGIDAPGSDTRYVSPRTSVSSVAPANNWLFNPSLTTISGRVRFDQVVNSANGIGTSVETDVPAGGAKLELRLANGSVVGTTFADTDGSFELSGKAINTSTSSTGSIRIVAGSPAASVVAVAGGQPASLTVIPSVELGEDSSLDPVTINDTLDPMAAFRQSFNIARVTNDVRAYAATRTGDSIPQLTVLFDSNNTQTTRYVPATDTTEAALRIGSSASSNPDGWDDDVIARAYAHHLVEYLTDTRGGVQQDGLDRVTNPANAFAEGFGAYLWAVISGDQNVVDATGANSGTSFDLEDPSTLTNARSPSVAGWVAAALYDLVDEDNETHDTIDGTVDDDADHPLEVVGELTTTASPTSFTDGWSDAGFDLAGLVTNYIHHGLLNDDDNEPNDSRDLATDLGDIGLLAGPFVLNRANADWFRVGVPLAVDALNVEVIYQRFSIPATVELEIYDDVGNLIATGAPDGTAGPYRATASSVAAGSYFVRVNHDSGPAIDSYQLQASSPLRFTAGSLPDWTIRQQYNQVVAVDGGIPPYTLTVEQPFSPPPGMILDSVGLRIVGAPTQLGRFEFPLSVRDSGNPVNIGSSTQSITINDELAFEIEDVLGFALGKPSDLQIERTGGTQPISVSTGDDDLPAGLTFTPDLRISGTATEAGGLPLHIEATDVAGSSAAADTTLVVCTPFAGKRTPVQLAEGAAAVGYYIDGLAGSEVNIKLKTSKKRQKRLLTAIVLGPDGKRVSGGSVTAKVGAASIKKLILPATGRYFAIFTSEAGAATQLEGTLKLKLQKKGKDGNEDFGAGDTETITFGVVAGATVKFKATGKLGLIVRPQILIGPDQSFVLGPDLDAKVSKAGFSFTRTLPVSGTWTLSVTREQGPAGPMTYSFKLKQPKGATFTID